MCKFSTVGGILLYEAPRSTCRKTEKTPLAQYSTRGVCIDHCAARSSGSGAVLKTLMS